jgi:hypothetical protein
VPENIPHHALGDRAAFQLANVTKTPPQYGAITPRWLVRLLDWKPLEAGTLRVNRVVEDKLLEVVCGQKDEKPLPESYLDYEENTRCAQFRWSLMCTPGYRICTAIHTTRCANSCACRLRM